MSSKITPQTLKGFRDFLPDEKRRRNYVMDKMREVFELFGFEPLETPTLEYASLLLGKYGKEADKLLYTFRDRGSREIALRYDQTVPTARVLAQNQNPEILPKILRRYQIQNVYRADKPQRGRYREFTQCDADIFASDNPIADAEIIAVFYSIYSALGLKSIQIMINDRTLLFNTISNVFSFSDERVFNVIQSLDKLGKESKDSVISELEKKGFNKKQSNEVIVKLSKAQPSSLLGNISELTVNLGVPKNILQFNPFLARGLDYYTGLIFEGIIPEYTVGSVGGGGRYDNLIEQLCNVNFKAVGFGIGFDRTVEAVTQLGLIPQQILSSTAEVLVAVFEKTTTKSLEIATILRSQRVDTEVFPIPAKLDKQLKYADKKSIPYVIIIGPEEVKKNVVKLKNMKTGEQEEMKIEDVVNLIKCRDNS